MNHVSQTERDTNTNARVLTYIPSAIAGLSVYVLQCSESMESVVSESNYGDRMPNRKFDIHLTDVR